MQVDPDKALRRLVSELAATTPEDMAAVLALLDQKSAAQVQGLLAAYAGVEGIFDLPETPYPPRIDTSGLSDWLAARVLGKPVGSPAAYDITPHARDVLRDIAMSMPPQHEAMPGPPPLSRQRASITNLIFRSLTGKRVIA